MVSCKFDDCVCIGGMSTHHTKHKIICYLHVQYVNNTDDHVFTSTLHINTGGFMDEFNDGMGSYPMGSRMM